MQSITYDIYSIDKIFTCYKLFDNPCSSDSLRLSREIKNMVYEKDFVPEFFVKKLISPYKKEPRYEQIKTACFATYHLATLNLREVQLKNSSLLVNAHAFRMKIEFPYDTITADGIMHVIHFVDDIRSKDAECFKFEASGYFIAFKENFGRYPSAIDFNIVDSYGVVDTKIYKSKDICVSMFKDRLTAFHGLLASNAKVVGSGTSCKFCKIKDCEYR